LWRASRLPAPAASVAKSRPVVVATGRGANLGMAAWARRRAQDEGHARADYRDWKDRAAAELERVHGVKASTTPECVWKKLYVQNMTPQEAAEQAAVSAYNARPASDRLRR
jgi:hypothetical protein